MKILIICLLVLLLTSVFALQKEKAPLDGRGGGIIAYSVTFPDATNQILLMNADGSGIRRITDQPGRPAGPAWSPDASKIAYYNHLSDEQWSLFVMDSDGGNPRRLSSGVGVLDWSPSWSPRGQRILFARSFPVPTWRSEIWMMDSDGTKSRRIGGVDGQGPAWSPDGRKIAYFNYVEGGGDIWIMDPDGKGVARLTEHEAEDWWPSWSPDGRKIVFQSKRDGNREIYVMNADGSNPERLTNNTADDEEPKWSPDGSKIAFISMRDGHYEIYVMDADGSNQRRLTHVDGHAINPAWKPVR